LTKTKNIIHDTPSDFKYQ